jgi:hypothetical protein
MFAQSRQPTFHVIVVPNYAMNPPVNYLPAGKLASTHCLAMASCSHCERVDLGLHLLQAKDKSKSLDGSTEIVE